MPRDIPKANPRVVSSGLPSEHPLASDSPQGELFPGLPLAFPQSVPDLPSAFPQSVPDLPMAFPQSVP